VGLPFFAAHKICACFSLSVDTMETSDTESEPEIFSSRAVAMQIDGSVETQQMDQSQSIPPPPSEAKQPDSNAGNIASQPDAASIVLANLRDIHHKIQHSVESSSASNLRDFLQNTWPSLQELMEVRSGSVTVIVEQADWELAERKAWFESVVAKGKKSLDEFIGIIEAELADTENTVRRKTQMMIA
jgi:hypothetical protein